MIWSSETISLPGANSPRARAVLWFHGPAHPPLSNFTRRVGLGVTLTGPFLGRRVVLKGSVVLTRCQNNGRWQRDRGKSDD